MKSDWDPSLYRQFENERTRPAHELLTRITLERPNHITDLGCGPGNSTALLAQKWPAAKVVGLDNSPAMCWNRRYNDYRSAHLNWLISAHGGPASPRT